MTNEELVRLAAAVRKNSYSPYSGYSVGAALLCEGGAVFTGVNVENISFGATICAERSAILGAVSAGERKFIKIAVAVSGEEKGIPCGMCLQFISEFAGADFEIICAGREGEFSVFRLADLMPVAFNSASIVKKGGLS